MQKGKKQITIRKKESEKSYLEDLQESQESHKQELGKREEYVLKSFQVPKSLVEQMKDYIYKRRTSGDVYYTQKQLVIDAFENLFKMP